MDRSWFALSEGLLMRKAIKFNQQRDLYKDATPEVAGNAIDTFKYYGVAREFMHDRYFFLVCELEIECSFVVCTNRL